eukprot:gene8733-18013_t
MSNFDAGKISYKNLHQIIYSCGQHCGQQTRHILEKDLLMHYGASPDNYARSVSYIKNYRMGDKRTNAMDRRIDKMVKAEVFNGQ